MFYQEKSGNPDYIIEERQERDGSMEQTSKSPIGAETALKDASTAVKSLHLDIVGGGLYGTYL
jgi:hypothetical protein